MPVRFVDPRAATAVPTDPYELALDPAAGPPVVGLLANGFPDSVAFVSVVGEVLQERVHGLRTRLWDKGNASAPATDQLLDGIAAEVEAVVTAYGH